MRRLIFAVLVSIPMAGYAAAKTMSEDDYYLRADSFVEAAVYGPNFDAEKGIAELNGGIERYQECLAAYPGSSECERGLVTDLDRRSRYFYDMKEYQKAADDRRAEIQFEEKLSSPADELSDVHRFLGDDLMALNRYDEAAKEYSAAYELYNNSGTAVLAAQATWAGGRHEESLKILNDAIVTAAQNHIPNYGNLYVERAHEHLMAGQCDAVAADFTEGCASLPSDVFLRDMGFDYCKINNKARCKKELAKMKAQARRRSVVASAATAAQADPPAAGK